MERDLTLLFDEVGHARREPILHIMGSIRGTRRCLETSRIIPECTETARDRRILYKGDQYHPHVLRRPRSATLPLNAPLRYQFQPRWRLQHPILRSTLSQR